MASLGLAASLGAIGYLLWEGLQPHTAPVILTARAQEVFATQTGYVVTIEVVNESRQTASAVEVEGKLLGERETETVNLTFDYVPGKGRRRGSIAFKGDPQQRSVHLSVKGQVAP